MSRVATTDLGEAAARAARGERVVVSHDGAEIALLPVSDLRALEELETLEDAYDVERAVTSLEEAAREGVASWEQVKAEARGARSCPTL